MDKLWLQNNLDLDMVAYNVLETGYMSGFIEFVDKAVEISEIHKNKHLLRGPFIEESVYDFLNNKKSN